MGSLGDFLKSEKQDRLETLNLEYNVIGDQGFIDLMSCMLDRYSLLESILKGKPPLLQLSVRETGITDSGFKGAL